MGTAEFRVSSRLRTGAAEVWDRVTTPEGINAEFKPLFTMTIPDGFERMSPESITLGEPIGRSWIRLFGVIPIDYDEICLVELEPGRRFLERSRMLSQRLWEHERTVEEAPGGCLVSDRIRFSPRGPVPAAALRPVYRWVFGRRHRSLRAQFGGEPA